MIDKNTGQIKLTDSLELKPNSNFDFLESQKLGEVQETQDMGNGYKWLHIKNIQIDNKYFIISLCFKEDELTELSMVLDDKLFDLSSDWSSWNEQKEKEDLKKYQGWLNKELGEETKFHWGDVWASYDPRAGSSSIGIRYK
jgi:predicted NACHT family NTPase